MPPPEPVMMQAGRSAIQSMVDPLSMADAKVKELELWTEDTLPVFSRVDPSLKAFLVPLANIGNAIKSRLAELRDRTAQPSPMMMGPEAMTQAAAGEPPAVGA
jgi:hypothetical protein